MVTERTSNSIGALCARCNNHAANRCGRCNEVTYCGRECQVSHWLVHKDTCGQLRNIYISIIENKLMDAIQNVARPTGCVEIEINETFDSICQGFSDPHRPRMAHLNWQPNEQESIYTTCKYRFSDTNFTRQILSKNKATADEITICF